MKDGEPCTHKGCLSHISHPCEGCGRVKGVMQKPKFQDGEKVLLDDVMVTIKEWSYIPKMNRFTYTIVENPSTFFFEHEFKQFSK